MCKDLYPSAFRYLKPRVALPHETQVKGWLYQMKLRGRGCELTGRVNYMYSQGLMVRVAHVTYKRDALFSPLSAWKRMVLAQQQNWLSPGTHTEETFHNVAWFIW